MIDTNEPNDPLAWLARAQSNIKLAELGHLQDGVFLEDLCFEAQQAAEKAFKAVCVYHKIEFPKTHSLVVLIDLLDVAGVNLPSDVKDADILTSYAVQARYPSWDEVVSEAEYQRTLDTARNVVSWAKEEIKLR